MLQEIILTEMNGFVQKIDYKRVNIIGGVLFSFNELTYLMRDGNKIDTIEKKAEEAGNLMGHNGFILHGASLTTRTNTPLHAQRADYYLSLVEYAFVEPIKK